MTSAEIGRFVTSERPRSPCAIWPMNSAYWTRSGLSSPSRCLSASRVAGLAWSPSTTMVGSPGTTRTSRNTSVSTAHRVGIARTSRLAMKRSMGSLRSPRGIPSPLRGGECVASTRTTSLLRRRFRDHRAEVDRVLEVVAEVDVGLVGPDLQLLEERHGADLVDDLALGRRPEGLLLREIRLGAGGVDLLVGDVAVREVRHRGRRADDRARVEELRQVHVGDGKARGRIVGRPAQVLADVGVEGLVVDDLELEVDAGLLQLALQDLRRVQHRG